MLEITNYGGEGPDQHYVRDEWECWWSYSLSFNRVYPIRYTSGKSPFIHFHPLMSVYLYNLLYFSKRCYLVVQVVGLLLPNQSLLSTVFWQVNSTYYLFIYLLLYTWWNHVFAVWTLTKPFCKCCSVPQLVFSCSPSKLLRTGRSECRAHLPTSLFCFTVIKPESQRLCQLLQPQCLSGSVSAVNSSITLKDTFTKNGWNKN